MLRSILLLRVLALIPNMITNAVPANAKNDDPIPIDKRTAEEIISQLNLTANVEKGYYIQTFQDPDVNSNNRSGSAGSSTWHRVDAAEVWHYYAGAPLTLSLSYNNSKPAREKVLGLDVFNGQQPQVVVSKFEWQRARNLGDWTLCGTTVAPGFVESGFEMPGAYWKPEDSSTQKWNSSYCPITKRRHIDIHSETGEIDMNQGKQWLGTNDEEKKFAKIQAYNYANLTSWIHDSPLYDADIFWADRHLLVRSLHISSVK
ncbi:RmlC-like cupin domain-containing protein [Pseudomassariella vexata]|uniref:RmlC-like cupin domain-containing protein n=1 Tax=Pseudomassariella vexata TaxID=1141098 RepID=A0A1Y2DJS3_9PEZI|nr:RmlC-like cupin domain-containing protein [Pseudomassariella vexata]ORY59497.1 RmlC-like cupin domain-containing protein [Pseudomassariella vexata]